MNAPIYHGKLQSDLDFAGFNPVNLTGWPPAGGGGGSSPLVTVNVKDAPYNATGNGVTDDTAAIQAAINAVGAAGGGVVFFPRGVYLCNGAFDATTNSILKFPYFPLQTAGVFNNPVTIELRGQAPQAISSVPMTNGSIIKSTKAGTGSHPSLLAAYSYLGRATPDPYTTVFSYVQPVIRNLAFVTDINPTIDAVRLDTAVMAIVEDVVISTGDGGSSNVTEPTHTTVGLWMPATLNFATSFCNRVWVAGFDTGMIATEHFRSPQCNLFNCHVGAEFLEGGELVWGNFLVFHCVTAIKFTNIGAGVNRCPVIFNLQNEYQSSGWQARTTDILDSSNNASGELRYFMWSGSATVPATVTGGANLRLINTGNVYNTYTVATLPTGVLGRTAVVTDGTASLAWGATVTGGGSTKYLVWYNGANWTVMGK